MSQRLESLIGLVLATGVILSLAVLVIALGFYLAYTGPEIVLSDKYRVISPNFIEYVKNLVNMDFGTKGLMSIGLILLMLTPYARVVASFTYFVAKRDLKYSLITAIVLVVLTISLLIH